jgi:WD40 repeat protein
MYVATLSSDDTAKIWDIMKISNTNWTLIRTYTGHTNAVYDCEFINEDLIATGSSDATIKIWSLSTGVTNRTINTNSDIFALKLLNNGFYMAVALNDNRIRVYNIFTGDLIANLTGHENSVFDLVLNNDLLISSNGDKTIKLWNMSTYKLISTLTGHDAKVFGLKLVSSSILASGSMDKSIKLWNLTNGALIRTLESHTNEIKWSIDLLRTDIIVSGSYDKTIKIWNVSTGVLLNTFNTYGGISGPEIKSLAILNSLPTATSSKTSFDFTFITCRHLFSLTNFTKKPWGWEGGG